MKRELKKFYFMSLTVFALIFIMSCATSMNIDGKYKENREDSITWVISGIGGNRFLVKAIRPDWYVSKSGIGKFSENILFVNIFFVDVEFEFSKEFNYFIYKNRKYIRIE